MAELDARAGGELVEHRPAVAEAANRALEGAVPPAAAEGLGVAVERMEAVCRGIRVGISNA